MFYSGFLIKQITIKTNEYREFSEADSYFTFTPDEENEGAKSLINIGLKEDDWFVSFHSRDPSYLKTLPSSKYIDYSYHDFRNCQIEKFYKGMNNVIDRGGFALQVGSVIEQQLRSETNTRLIDYAGKHRTDFMDIYVNARCRFFIGNTSGLFHVPKAFGTPYAITNLIGFLHISPQPNSLFIPKLIRDKKSDKIISFMKLKELGLFNEEYGKAAYHAEFYETNNMEVIENTEDEIAELVDDMFDLTNKNKPDLGEIELQRFFKDIYYNENPDRHDAGNLAPSFIRRHEKILFP